LWGLIKAWESRAGLLVSSQFLIDKKSLFRWCGQMPVETGLKKRFLINGGSSTIELLILTTRRPTNAGITFGCGLNSLRGPGGPETDADAAATEQPAGTSHLHAKDFALSIGQALVDALGEVQALAAPVRHPADAVAEIRSAARVVRGVDC